MPCKGKSKPKKIKKAMTKKKPKKSGPSQTTSARANGGYKKLRP